ncbi:asparaginase [Gephyromycinifex aptenodytis]|uniref:asparaginase n=1 Tax=Gephyromycinifex aptenodytis TaxID=2716227 RepID=UPI0014482D14|nr:asparaginase [Gephyromycinifex aptenodytis]
MPTSSPPQSRPGVVILGTGGTIAGSTAAALGHHYTAGVLSIEELLASAPGLADIAQLRCQQLFSLDSVELDLPRQLQLARRVAQIAADPDVDGVVITHGTDTMEESAYLLHLLVGTDKPVVLTGAMRPADAPGADGPANILDAVTVAASPAAHGLGTLVVFGGAVHSGREVSKRISSRLDAFDSFHGPLGDVSEQGLLLYGRPARRFGADSAFELASLPESLPSVELLLSHPDMPASICRAILDSGAAGIVHAGPGGGNVATPVARMLDEARERGVVVVRSSRVGAGVVARNGAVSDTEHGWVAAGDLNPFKARVLLALALTQTSDVATIQRLFDTH